MKVMQKPFVLFTIFLFMMSALAPAVTANQGKLEDSKLEMQELFELDMAGLNSDIELIEIDPELSNSTPDWMFLAHDEAGKMALLNRIDEASSTVSEKKEMIDAVNQLWDTYPTKFESAGQKTIEITVQSDGSNRTQSIPIGHVTRISFDREKIKETAESKNTSQAIKLRNLSTSSSIVLSDSENETIKDLTQYRIKERQTNKGSHQQQSTSDTSQADSPNNFLLSESQEKIVILSPGLMAWGGWISDDPYVSGNNKYSGHNSFVYWAAVRSDTFYGYEDTAAMAALYPDEVIDSTTIPSWVPFADAINAVFHSVNHYWNPNLWNPDTGSFGFGGAPLKTAEYASQASISYGQDNYLTAATNLAYASHYLADAGNPMHTGREFEQYNDVLTNPSYDTHGKYELYINKGWQTGINGPPFKTKMETDLYYYPVSDPAQATKNLATFSNAYLDTLYYRVRNNEYGDDIENGFPTDIAVRLISENCIIATKRYTYGLFKYVEDSSTENSPPIPDFTYQVLQSTSDSAVIKFTDTSFGATSRAWSFGDGQTAGNESPVQHTYNGANDYYTQLAVVNQHGTTTKGVIIPVGHLPPSPDFIPVATDLRTFHFIDNTKPVTGVCKPTKWSWNFGDLSPASAEQNPSHQYTLSGTYLVTLTAGNIYGDQSLTLPVFIIPGAVAQFVYEIIGPKKVKFTSTSTNAASHYWDFENDGIIDSTEHDPVHEYTESGTYSVNLTVKDSNYDYYNTSIQDIDFSSPDKIGVFRNGSWYLDVLGNGNSGESQIIYFGIPGDQAVSGDWNDDGKDEIGVYRDGAWYIDYNGNGIWDDESHIVWFGLSGDQAVPGDWNDDGKDEIGVYRDGAWYIDYNGNGFWDGVDASHLVWFGIPGDHPEAGKW